MSTATYESMLREAIVDLAEMQEEDSQAVGRKVGSSRRDDHDFFLQHWTAMYLRYTQITRRVELVHDQLLQPQQRQDVRVLLDSCIGRMLEIKRTLVEFCGEYVNLDEALVDLKLTPEALEVPIPKYIVEERFEEITDRRRFVASLIDHYRKVPDAPVAQVNEPPPPEAPMTLEGAVLLLQCCERGRQARQTMRFQRIMFEHEAHQQREFESSRTTGKDGAATRIQKIVLGYLARKKTNAMLRQELEFLGMEPSTAVRGSEQQQRLTRTAEERKMKQSSNVTELEQEARELRTKIKKQEGSKAMEEMLDEILIHLANVRLASKEDTLPAFPTPEEGGSLALLGRTAVTPEAPEATAPKKPAKGGKEPQKAPKKDGKKDPKKQEEEEIRTIAPSRFWDRFSDVKQRYASSWQPRFQRSYFGEKDFDQSFDAGLLREEVTEGPGGTLQELRRCVDHLVMIEVANLRERMERERGMKKRNRKKPKAKRPPKLKDPYEGKTIETAMNLLVYLNIMQLPPENVRLADFLGPHNVMESAMAEYARMRTEHTDEVKAKWQTLIANWNPYVEQSLRMTKEQFEVLFKQYCEQSSWMFEPSAAQVRQQITERCILPLGSQIIHDLAPVDHAILLYGFAKSGKTMLVHAICNEAGANLFDLSPATLSAPQLGKAIQNTFRVARALAPSVIYIDDAEKIFVGKGKKKGKRGDAVATRAGKMKKDLLAQMRELTPADRVLVVGTSRQPWEADLKELCGFFSAMVCCVHPDYAARMELWQKLLAKRGVTLPNLQDYEVLAYMTNKYTSGAIAAVIDQTLTPQRLRRVKQKPVVAQEFLVALSTTQPIFREEYVAMQEFVRRLPMSLRRIAEEDFVDVVEDPKAAKGKGKGKGKKGK